MTRRLLLAAVALLCCCAQAQPQGFDPELFERMEPYLDLNTTVMLLLQLEQESDVPLTSEQAAQLLPYLIELDSSPGYTPERALELRDEIELGLLTGEQLIWIDGAFLAQQEAAAAGGGSPLGRGPVGGGGRDPARAADGQRSDGAPAGNRALFQQLANGEPVNLLASDQGPGALLDELIVLVQGKLE